MNDVLVSVVIPVHNGEKYILKTAKNILSQTLTQIELILVENYSSDYSLEMCKRIQKSDDRVKLFQSFEKGTSYARKKGIEVANGKYLFFCDQDDKVINKKALENMYLTITSSNSQICQFAIYNSYFCGIKRLSAITDRSVLVSVDDIRKNEIGGLFGKKDCLIDNGVFSKIYATELLKDCINDLKYELYTCEDTYLNFCCIKSELLKKAYVDNKAYYIHKRGTGITSTVRFGEQLFKDYDVIKPIIDAQMHSFNSSFAVFYQMHLESLHFMLAHIVELYNKVSYNELLERIEEYSNYTFIKIAKRFMNNYVPKNLFYGELAFLSSDYSPKEYYDFFKKRFESSQKLTYKKIAKKILRIC